MSSAVTDIEERTLMQHLLGLLPEAEQDRLDELSVSDDAVAARLSDAENDLVDAYVRGELAGEELERFTTHYLTSERRRRKVLVAEALFEFEKSDAGVRLRRAPRSAAPIRAARPSIRRMAWAAVAVLSVAAGIFVLDDLRVRHALASTTAALSALETRVRESTADLTLQAARTGALQAEVSRLEGMITGSRSVPGPAAKPEPLLIRVASFLLAAPVRGVQAVPVLSVPGDAARLLVTLKLEDAEFGRYRVNLTPRAARTMLWRSPMLKAVTDKHGAVLKIELPADVARSGTYSFEVVGFDHGREVAVASYPFDVDREE